MLPITGGVCVHRDNTAIRIAKKFDYFSTLPLTGLNLTDSSGIS
jgi:hypothetical protein